MARMALGGGRRALPGRLGSVWEGVNSTFWFLPGSILTGAVLLCVGTLWLDRRLHGGLSGLPLLLSGGPDAARTILSTVVGSMITVVATVFSLTIVALQLASARYSPRLLRNFTENRGIQFVLGAYIGTFAYALLTLRAVRRSSDGGAYVPHISASVAAVLAFGCVGLLVYLIHHVASVIQASSILQEAHRRTIQSMSHLRDLGTSRRGTSAAAWEEPQEDPFVIRASRSGYVQHVNLEAVADALSVSGRRVLAELPFGPGSFVSAGMPLARVWAPCGLEEGSVEELHLSFYFGRERSFRQDFAFGIRQLVDVGLRGISPAVNDPTTTMQALDRIEAILVALGSKELPEPVRLMERDGGSVMLKVGFYGFDDVVGLAFDELRRSCFAGEQVSVLERLVEVARRTMEANGLPQRRRALWREVYAVARVAPGSLSDPADAAGLLERAAEAGGYLLQTGQVPEVRCGLEEISRLAGGLPGGQKARRAAEAALGGPS